MLAHGVISAMLGVMPPADKLRHNSMRYAPARLRQRVARLPPLIRATHFRLKGESCRRGEVSKRTCPQFQKFRHAQPPFQPHKKRPSASDYRPGLSQVKSRLPKTPIAPDGEKTREIQSRKLKLHKPVSTTKNSNQISRALLPITLLSFRLTDQAVGRCCPFTSPKI